MATKPTTKQTRERRPAISDLTLQLAIQAIEEKAGATLAARANGGSRALEDKDDAFVRIGELYAAQRELLSVLDRRAGNAPTQG